MTKMDVKYLVLLFLYLSVKLQTASQMSHKCNTATLPNCNNNTMIQVIKTLEKYHLKLCRECIPGNRQNDTESHSDYCMFVPYNSRQDRMVRHSLYNDFHVLACPDNGNKPICGEQVEMLLNDFCALATFTHTTERVVPTCTTVIDRQTSNTTVTLTVTSTVPPQYTSSPVTSATDHTQPSPSMENTTLGVVSGMFLLLLVMVITGWVCTFWTMKRKINEVKSIAQNRAVDASTQNEQKCFDNPTYGGTCTSIRPPEPQEYEIPIVVHQQCYPQVTYTMYDAVKNPASQESTESEHEYDKLNENGNTVSDMIKPKVQM